MDELPRPIPKKGIVRARSAKREARSAPPSLPLSPEVQHACPLQPGDPQACKLALCPSTAGQVLARSDPPRFPKKDIGQGCTNVPGEKEKKKRGQYHAQPKRAGSQGRSRFVCLRPCCCWSATWSASHVFQCTLALTKWASGPCTCHVIPKEA